MCGIAGIVAVHGDLGDADDAALRRMLAALGHRGPDDAGCWKDPRRRVILGHARLAIVDLSPAGHEPILSHDGAAVLSFNGEVFNHVELRHRMRDAPSFRGHCDAETLVEAWARDGASVLPGLRGFFAFGVWSDRDEELVLARDRLGKKPLYYAVQAGRVAFASEVRGLLAGGFGTAAISPVGLSRYLSVGCIPPPLTIVDGIRAVPPATVLTVQRHRGIGEPRRWWAPPTRPSRRLGGAWWPKAPALSEELEDHLRASVRDRLMADVPVGAFLSGGVDSPVIAALAQQEGTGTVRTFTVGFEADGAVDERPAARRVAELLGCDHHERTVSSDEILPVFGRFLDSLDVPSGDAFNSYLAASAAEGATKVVLSGVGADELFYGYAFWRRAVQLGWLGRLIRAAPLGWRVGTGEAVGGAQLLGPAGRAAKAVTVALAPELGRVTLTSRERRVLGMPPDDAPAWVHAASVPSDPGRHADMACYLGPQLLADLDAMTMAFSMEARAPFVDHRLVEWALMLPPAVHWDGGGGKALLRTVARRVLPAELVDRPKQGFDLPFAAWLAGPLRTAADDLLRAAARRGIVREAAGMGHLQAVRAGRRHPRSIWHVLVLEAWLQRHLPDAYVDPTGHGKVSAVH